MILFHRPFAPALLALALLTGCSLKNAPSGRMVAAGEIMDEIEEPSGPVQKALGDARDAYNKLLAEIPKDQLPQ